MKILAIHAHPDDLEFLVGGTLAHLSADHELTLATFTPGDCGSAAHTREEIARIRRGEARAAAALLGADYFCLEQHDLEITITNELRKKVTELLRTTRPELVFTASPEDYMADHMNASAIVRDACFNAPVPLYETAAADPAPALTHVPGLLYADPIELIDNLGVPVTPHYVVDITSTLERKVELLACHASQREWLRKHHGIDAYIETMKSWSAERGRLAGVPFGEGFRQHRGHSYPRDNVLEQLLGRRITEVK